MPKIKQSKLFLLTIFVFCILLALIFFKNRFLIISFTKSVIENRVFSNKAVLTQSVLNQNKNQPRLQNNLSKHNLKQNTKLNTHLNIKLNMLKKNHISNLLKTKNTKQYLFQLVKNYKKYFLYCQANAIRKNINPTGKALINLHIINNNIIDVYIISSNLHSYLQKCALSIFKKIKLKTKKKQNLWIRYPLYFL